MWKLYKTEVLRTCMSDSVTQNPQTSLKQIMIVISWISSFLYWNFPGWWCLVADMWPLSCKTYKLLNTGLETSGSNAASTSKLEGSIPDLRLTKTFSPCYRHHFDTEWKISMNDGWISIKFCACMFPREWILSYPVAPPWSKYFWREK